MGQFLRGSARHSFGGIGVRTHYRTTSQYSSLECGPFLLFVVLYVGTDVCLHVVKSRLARLVYSWCTGRCICCLLQLRHHHHRRRRSDVELAHVVQGEVYFFIFLRHWRTPLLSLVLLIVLIDTTNASKYSPLTPLGLARGNRKMCRLQNRPQEATRRLDLGRVGSAMNGAMRRAPGVLILSYYSTMFPTTFDNIELLVLLTCKWAPKI